MLLGTAVGLTLSANYAEEQLSARVQQLRSTGMSPESWIPEGCTYGIYDGKGRWLSGNFTEKEQKNAWTQFKKITTMSRRAIITAQSNRRMEISVS